MKSMFGFNPEATHLPSSSLLWRIDPVVGSRAGKKLAGTGFVGKQSCETACRPAMENSFKGIVVRS